MLSDMQLTRIAENVIATGGATFNANGLFSYVKGFQVGIAGCGTTKDLSAVKPEDMKAVLECMVESFAARKWTLLEDGFDLGAWVSDGVLYLDVTRHYSDQALACKRGAEMGEKAIWDWATMSEVPCPNYYVSH